jgi:DNA-binding transcriptional MerR regulator
VHQAGITYRQLDYWTRRGYITPENSRYHSGIEREWSRAELGVALRMGRLITAGLSAEVAARVAREGCGRLEIAPGIVIEVAA